MSWKFVFNPKFSAGSDLDKVARFVITTGYDFFVFNGIVYFIVILENGFSCEVTEITVEDLF